MAQTADRAGCHNEWKRQPSKRLAGTLYNLPNGDAFLNHSLTRSNISVPPSSFTLFFSDVISDPCAVLAVDDKTSVHKPLPFHCLLLYLCAARSRPLIPAL
jgi:hypothetical protein